MSRHQKISLHSQIPRHSQISLHSQIHIFHIYIYIYTHKYSEFAYIRFAQQQFGNIFTFVDITIFIETYIPYIFHICLYTICSAAIQKHIYIRRYHDIRRHFDEQAQTFPLKMRRDQETLEHTLPLVRNKCFFFTKKQSVSFHQETKRLFLLRRNKACLFIQKKISK